MPDWMTRMSAIIADDFKMTADKETQTDRFTSHIFHLHNPLKGLRVTWSHFWVAFTLSSLVNIFLFFRSDSCDPTAPGLTLWLIFLIGICGVVLGGLISLAGGCLCCYTPHGMPYRDWRGVSIGFGVGAAHVATMVGVLVGLLILQDGSLAGNCEAYVLTTRLIAVLTLVGGAAAMLVSVGCIKVSIEDKYYKSVMDSNQKAAELKKAEEADKQEIPTVTGHVANNKVFPE